MVIVQSPGKVHAITPGPFRGRKLEAHLLCSMPCFQCHQYNPRAISASERLPPLGFGPTHSAEGGFHAQASLWGGGVTAVLNRVLCHILYLMHVLLCPCSTYKATCFAEALKQSGRLVFSFACWYRACCSGFQLFQRQAGCFGPESGCICGPSYPVSCSSSGSRWRTVSLLKATTAYACEVCKSIWIGWKIGGLPTPLL